MVNIIKTSIDIISPSNGKHYTCRRAYEKDLSSKGLNIMEDKSYRHLREKLMDESRSAPPKKADPYNHVHIDLNNGRVEKSVRQLDE